MIHSIWHLDTKRKYKGSSISRYNKVLSVHASTFWRLQWDCETSDGGMDEVVTPGHTNQEFEFPHFQQSFPLSGFLWNLTHFGKIMIISTLSIKQTQEAKKRHEWITQKNLECDSVLEIFGPSESAHCLQR